MGLEPRELSVGPLYVETTQNNEHYRLIINPIKGMPKFSMTCCVRDTIQDISPPEVRSLSLSRSLSLDRSLALSFPFTPFYDGGKLTYTTKLLSIYILCFSF
jgi:hypothetical protein